MAFPSTPGLFCSPLVRPPVIFFVIKLTPFRGIISACEPFFACVTMPAFYRDSLFIAHVKVLNLSASFMDAYWSICLT